MVHFFVLLFKFGMYYIDYFVRSSGVGESLGGVVEDESALLVNTNRYHFSIRFYFFEKQI